SGRGIPITVRHSRRYNRPLPHGGLPMRNSLLLVLVMAIWMGVMWYVGDCPGVNSALPGISKPSMAVQFARSEADVIAALGFPGNCWTAVRHQQYFDFVYILLYWSFFFF